MKADNPENTGSGRDEKGKFIKGVSGNPTGKPNGAFSLIAILKRELQKIPEGKQKPYAELLIQKMLKLAVEEGDQAQIRNILQYIEGMPKQSIDMDMEVSGLETLFKKARE